MNRIAAGLFAAVTIAGICHSQTLPDLNDAALVGYRLTASEEAQYQANRTTVSPFWTEFEVENAMTLFRDFVFMASDNAAYSWNETPGISFAGHDDAQTTVRFAYGARGTYFYFLIEDNVWTPYSSWQTDCVDFFIDTMPLARQTVDGWFNPTQWSLSYTSKQIQISFGDTVLKQIDVRKFDGNTHTMGDNITLNDTIDTQGYSWNFVSVDSSHRAVELFVPYSEWGLQQPPAANTRLCFTVAYNDVDDGVPTDAKSMRWVGLCDPYCGVTNAYWGEVAFGPALSDSTPVVQKHLERPASKLVSSSELFTLRGDKVSKNSSRVVGLVVNRQVLVGRAKLVAVGVCR